MKEIKAFIHRNRAADVVHALHTTGFCRAGCNLSLTDVAGSLKSLGAKEKNFSVEFGESLINEVKLELVCDDSQVDEAIELIRDNARTGQAVSGWIYVSEISNSYRIDESDEPTDG
ncbi:MAG TPA: P-II family nitrogen regulator [Woeseiaceae bacterium]|nr:P-II family nitrogen regulator [Woeseiaceae bacterium]